MAPSDVKKFYIIIDKFDSGIVGSKTGLCIKCTLVASYVLINR